MMGQGFIRLILAIGVMGALSACAATGTSPGGGAAATAPRPVPAASTTPPPAPTIRDPLIGQSANAVTRLFGTPRLDVREGAGRKLQFTGAACVLDVYLYPPRSGADAVVSHLDARNAAGADVDYRQCVSALRQR